MKIIKYIPLFLILLGLTATFNSCQEETFSKEDFEWKEEPMTIVMPGEYKNFFFATNSNSFIVNEIDMNITVLPASADDAQVVDKVEIYAFFLETSGGEQIMHGGQDGKLVATLTDIGATGTTTFNVTIDEVYDLFASDFIKKDRPAKLLTSDLVEFKWVITDASGNVTDTRLDCMGSQCQYIFGVESGVACSNNLAGTFDYEVLEKGSYPPIAIGATGTVTLTRLSLAGDYEIDDAEFGGSWNGDPVPSAVKDDCTGLITLTNSHDNVWEFISFDGPNCTVKWTNKWTQYGEWAVVRLTRQDGQDWPTELRGVNQ